jgi:putative peptidoglycan lipid II flippase
MKNNELFRASGIMAIGTILSRLTGFVRALLAVAVLGTALLADTYLFGHFLMKMVGMDLHLD